MSAERTSNRSDRERSSPTMLKCASATRRARIRYVVLPLRPKRSASLSRNELENLITRDSMIVRDGRAFRIGKWVASLRDDRWPTQGPSFIPLPCSSSYPTIPPLVCPFDLQHRPLKTASRSTRLESQYQKGGIVSPKITELSNLCGLKQGREDERLT